MLSKISLSRTKVISALQLSIRAAFAAGLAVAIAHLLGLQYPLYALVSAVIVTDLSSSKTRELALPRTVGTIIGAILGALIIPLLHSGAWAVGVGIFGAMFLTQILGIPAAAKIAGYVCGIVVLEHGDYPWNYALHRFLETVLGIAVAVLVSFVPKLLSKEDAPSK